MLNIRKPKHDNDEMSFSEHLKELRNRLICVILVFIAAFIAWYIKSENLISGLVSMGKESGFTMVYTSPQEILIQELHIATVMGFVSVIPVLLYEICAFILPAFDRNVKWLMITVCIIGMGLFAAGAVFAGRYLLPFIYKMLFGISMASGAVRDRIYANGGTLKYTVETTFPNGTVKKTVTKA